MPKKSIGTLLFAHSFIIFSIIRLVFTRSIQTSYDNLPPQLLILIMAFTVICNISLIIAGIFLLKGREWARKLALIGTGIGLIYFLAVALPQSQYSMGRMPSTPQYQEMIMQGYKELPAEAKGTSGFSYEEFEGLVVNFISDSARFGRIVTFLYIIGALFFLSRPRTKKQFK